MRYIFYFFCRYELCGEWNYFEAYHGQSLCNSHAHRIGQAKRNSEINGNVIVKSHSSKELLELKLKNTTCIVLDIIDR